MEAMAGVLAHPCPPPKLQAWMPAVSQQEGLGILCYSPSSLIRLIMSHRPGLCGWYPHFMETRMTEVLSGGMTGNTFIQPQPSGVLSISFTHRITGSYSTAEAAPPEDSTEQFPALAGWGQGRAQPKRPLRFTSGWGDQSSLVGWSCANAEVKKFRWAENWDL